MDGDSHDGNARTAAAKYADWVSLLRDDSAYLRAAPAPAYWALAPHYVGQYTECACSLASAVMIVNAARSEDLRKSGSKTMSQPALLDAVGSAEWRAEVGHDGGQGVGLSHLRTLLDASLKAVGVAPARVEAFPLQSSASDG